MENYQNPQEFYEANKEALHAITLNIIELMTMSQDISIVEETDLKSPELIEGEATALPLAEINIKSVRTRASLKYFKDNLLFSDKEAVLLGFDKARYMGTKPSPDTNIAITTINGLDEYGTATAYWVAINDGLITKILTIVYIQDEMTTVRLDVTATHDKMVESWIELSADHFGKIVWLIAARFKDEQELDFALDELRQTLLAEDKDQQEIEKMLANVRLRAIATKAGIKLSNQSGSNIPTSDDLAEFEKRLATI